MADACWQLNERLAPYKANLPGASFKEVVNAAYLDRCDLSAHGFYATPDITGAAPFLYHSSCSPVLRSLSCACHLWCSNYSICCADDVCMIMMGTIIVPSLKRQKNQNMVRRLSFREIRRSQ